MTPFVVRVATAARDARAWHMLLPRLSYAVTVASQTLVQATIMDLLRHSSLNASEAGVS